MPAGRTNDIYRVRIVTPEGTDIQFAASEEVAEQLEQAARYRSQFVQVDVAKIRVATTREGLIAFARSIMERTV